MHQGFLSSFFFLLSSFFFLLSDSVVFADSYTSKNSKPYSFEAGAIPNSDRLVDTTASGSVDYGFGCSAFAYLNKNSASIVKTAYSKNSLHSNIKAYDLLIFALPERRVSLFSVFYSIGAGYRYVESEDNISTVVTTVSGRFFSDETRKSYFKQPYVTLSLDYQLADSLWAGVKGFASPYMWQSRRTELAKSSEVEDTRVSGNDRGMEYRCCVYADYDFSLITAGPGYAFTRRLFSTTINTNVGTAHTFETVDSMETDNEIGIMAGLKFLGNAEDGTYPSLYVARYYSQSRFLAENPVNDQTIDDSGWRFGVIVNIGKNN